MGPFLYAAWFRTDAGALSAVLDAVRPVAPIANAYELVRGGENIQAIGSRLERLPESEDLTESPSHLVIADVGSLAAGLDVRSAVDQAAPAPLVTALFAKIATYPGTDPAAEGRFAPAIQLGSFNMPSAEGDWAITDWYENRRMPAFQAMEGSVRSFRIVAVCGALARMGVFYEFTSMELRDASFESIEEEDHDVSRPTAATRTIHPRMSPSIGARLAV